MLIGIVLIGYLALLNIFLVEIRTGIIIIINDYHKHFIKYYHIYTIIYTILLSLFKLLYYYHYLNYNNLLDFIMQLNS
jgi:hypothetical protein